MIDDWIWQFYLIFFLRKFTELFGSMEILYMTIKKIRWELRDSICVDILRTIQQYSPRMHDGIKKYKILSTWANEKKINSHVDAFGFVDIGKSASSPYWYANMRKFKTIAFFSLDRPEITTAAAAATAKKSNGKINAMIFVGPFRWDLSPYYIYVTIILIIIIVI